MKKIFPIVVLLLIILLGGAYYAGYIPSYNDYITGQQEGEKPEDPLVVIQNNPRLLAAYQNRITKLQIEGQGMIIKVLKDDEEGSRHQRLLLRVNKDQTLLITHNIDLASRIPNPKVGEAIKFYGEYVWNNKGGLVHWTHKDPRKRHEDGWLLYQGKRYE